MLRPKMVGPKIVSKLGGRKKKVVMRGHAEWRSEVHRVPCGVPFQPLGAQVRLLQLSRSSCRRGGWRMCIERDEGAPAGHLLRQSTIKLPSVDTQNTALPSL